jgi:tRNA nucleotidyltransferase/poly(A) polymerase
MEFTEYPLLQRTVELLQAQQVEAYLVGGAVRDLLLERPKIVDFDFVTARDGLKVARRVADALGAAFYPLDAERDTGRVVYQREGRAAPTYLDFASFRGPDLQADLADRDFTINAIALNLAGQVIDPLQGRQDLQRGRIRAASAEAFQRDPVRILRAVRQAVAFGFEIEAETEKALRQAIPLLKRVSPERQRDELLKLLNTPAPGEAIRHLQRLDVLARWLPEVEAMVGVTQSAPHYLDVFDHTTAALAAWAERWQKADFGLPAHLQTQTLSYLNQSLGGNLPQASLMPLALLFHDTGKPRIRTEALKEDELKIHFYGHEQKGARLVRRAMQRLHFSSQATDFVETVVAQHMRPLSLASAPEGKVSRRAIFRFFQASAGHPYNAGVAVTLHALADHYGTYPPGEGRPAEEALRAVINPLLVAFFEQQETIDPPLLLSGHDLMETLGLPQGQLIGLLLRRLKEAQATGQVTTREGALAFIKADPDFAASQVNGL